MSERLQRASLPTLRPSATFRYSTVLLFLVGGAGIVLEAEWEGNRVAVKEMSELSLCFSEEEFLTEVGNKRGSCLKRL